MRIRMMVLTSVLAALLVAGVVPAAANFSNGPSSAGIVERFDDPGFGFWVNEEAGLLAFANVNSVADACEGIPAGPGDVQLVSLPGGVQIFLLHDDDVPILVVPLAPPEVICDDPDSWPVIATGFGDVRGQDNDANGSGTRGNSFGTRVNGSVVDVDGGLWNIQASFRARVTKKGDFKVRETVHLVPRGF